MPEARPAAVARRMRPLLGTFVEVGAACAHGAHASAALDAAFGVLEACHARWSFHAPDSELSRLNRAPGVAVPVSAETLRLLRLARAFTRLSGGRFNFALGGELVCRGVLPDHGPAALVRIGQADDLQTGPGWARLLRPVRITLDGIAKGYAVDLAVRALRRAGATGGWVNAGGDMRVFGDRTLPVQRREADGRRVALGVLRCAAMASSRWGGAHDLSFPGCIVGGGPAPAQVVTVIAGTAWRADALTKVAALSAPGERAAQVARLGGALVAGGAAATVAA
ncbi:MAG: FAD:protein FMN transferase [Pseudomonadota bacterium]